MKTETMPQKSTEKEVKQVVVSSDSGAGANPVDAFVKSGKVGSSPSHLSGREHVTGRSQFIDDIPKPRNMLYVKVLTSPVAHGIVRELDCEEARKVPGVKAVLTYRDIPGENQIGAILPDETCLAEEHVHFVGEPVAVVAAETAEIAEEAMGKIRLNIEELTPVLTIDDAVAKNQFVGPIRKIERGNVDEMLKNSPHYLEGKVVNGGQEHFYLETQSALAIPEDSGAITIYSSTQNPNEIQRMASNVLGKPQSEVTVDVKRIGGGFGGKESQATSWASIAALAAHHTGLPCLCKLDREEDMISTGKRHVFESTYRVGFDDNGKILAFDVVLCSNAGAVADASTSILERAMLHADNIYNIDNIRVIGKPCRTNLHPATAFRGFGGPQGILVIETILEIIANKLKIDPFDIRLRNIYKEGDKAHYGEPVKNVRHMETILKKLRHDSDWDERKRKVAEFNAKNKYLKKGLGVAPVKFGISFTAAHLNQAGSLVHVYFDGSVSVSHGAIEMGQEVNTKIGQIAATTLGVPLSTVRVESTNTKRVANSSPTAASSGCDLNGQAVENAAMQIHERLTEFAKTLFNVSGVRFEDGMVYAGEAGKVNYAEPLISFNELIKKAYFQRVDLTAHGFYASPGIWFDREKGVGNPFLYFVYGAGVTEVTVDTLTGQTKLDYVRILHDSGQSLNPAVDIGQIYGAYIQAYGWATTEELVYSEGGKLLSNSPATYKIPTYGDVPTEFYAELFSGSTNELGVKRSKANGEPPFIYGESVLFAIADAIASTGKYPVNLSIPATPEKVWKEFCSEAG
ncbi:MAG: xanthine dehydrogenase molybdopterin binding subunit [Firmicutes bacterium]|nr:xanthine dehydrogenase molybdopterin binding subunit [Bacillota bacterium]